MSEVGAARETPRARSVRTPAVLSVLAAVLVALCTAAPMVAPTLYRSLVPSLVAGTYGQDVTSLALIAVLVWAIRSASSGSLRGPIVWLAVLAFWAYGYALFAFGSMATPLYPAHIAILGLTVYGMLALVARPDIGAYAQCLSDRAPRWPTAAMLGVTVGLLGPVWVALMVGGLATGKLPTTANVFVLDLGLVFPAMVTAVVGLVRLRPWAWPLAGSLVLLAAAMLGSLVVSDTVAVVLRVPGDPWPLTLTFAVLALAAVAASVTILSRLGDEQRGQ